LSSSSSAPAPAIAPAPAPAPASAAAPAADFTGEEVDYGAAGDGGEGEGGGGDGDGMDDELAAIQAQLDEAEEANATLLDSAASASRTAEEIQKERADKEAELRERDERSIFVNGVDFGATADELAALFSTCGSVNAVKIITDRFGTKNGQAYVQFDHRDAVERALILDGVDFKNRKISVRQKRTNVPSHLRGGGGRGGRGGRGAAGAAGGAYRGRGGGRGGMGMFGAPMGFGVPMMMPAYMAAGGMYLMGGRGGGRGRGGYRGRGGAGEDGGFRGRGGYRGRGRGGGAAGGGEDGE